jgi:predicted transcriptional regulator
MPSTPLIAFRLEERDNKRLRQLAAESKQSLSDFIRDAVRHEMDRRETNNNTNS